MATTFPGTTIETTKLEKGSSRQLFDGIFATGGITLSQVSVMTGLEPYLIQNWVKRKFLTSPVNRVYSRQQFARIIIINMLRESLQIDKICGLIHIIGGVLEDPDDDLIKDNELYHLYVDMLAEHTIDIRDEKTVKAAARDAVADFPEADSEAKKKLSKLLQVMYFAHTASKLRNSAEEILYTLE